MLKDNVINKTFEKRSINYWAGDVEFNFPDKSVLARKATTMANYRRWFWSQINNNNEVVLNELLAILEKWIEHKRVVFPCKEPEKESFHDVIIEWLSWTIWKSKILPDHVFTTQASKSLLS